MSKSNIYFFKFTFVAFILLWAITTNAQGIVFGRLIDHVNDLVTLMPGSSGNNFTNPSSDEVDLIEEAFDYVISMDLESAASTAAEFQYVVLRFVDNTLENNQEFVILQPAPDGNNYWGTLIFNPDACSDLIIQCPHPRFDSNTGVQGAYIFTRIDARAMLLSGTHRCNSNTASSCSGSTSVCGSSAAYRISDVAHNDKSGYHWLTRFLDNTFEQQVFMQLHGFARQSSDPNLIVSNGTRDTPEPDPIASLRASLNEIDPAITFKIANIHTEWTRLIGFTNTQGRYLNTSPDACSANASIASGKFIHLEQEFDMFRKDETGWDLMYRGLDDAFGCTGTDTEFPNGPEFTIQNNSISFENIQQNKYLLQVVSFDGQTIYSKKVEPGAYYDLPQNTFIAFCVRDIASGKIKLTRKIYLVN